MGVQTVKLTEARGQLAGARVVRDGYQVMLISTGGTVIKMPVEDVKRLGRSTQGVIVMRLRDGETVSSLAPVIDASEEEPAVDSELEPELEGLLLEAEDEAGEEDALEEDEPSTE
jgi:DNA gyrase subunit A